jgi:hypothetical protein
VGLQGQSYAIPTMQAGVDTIRPYVDDFIAFAKNHPEKKFLFTQIGCGIAGFSPVDIKQNTTNRRNMPAKSGTREIAISLRDLSHPLYGNAAPPIQTVRKRQGQVAKLTV